MSPDDFRQRLQRNPFQPFGLHLSTGFTQEVRHPEMAGVGRSIVRLYTPASQYPCAVADREVIVVPVHIVRIEFVEAAATPSAN